MIKFFSDIKAVNPLALLFFLLCVRVFFVIGYAGQFDWKPENHNYTEYVFSILNQNLYIAFILSTAIVYVSALLFNNMIIQHDILFKRNYLGAYFYCLIASILPEYYLLGSAIFINLLMIIAMQRMFDLYKVPYPYDNIFLIGILSGVSVLFSISYILIFLYMIVGIMFFRAIKITEIVASLLGFVLPVFMAFALNYLINGVAVPDYLQFNSFDTKTIQDQILFTPLLIIALIAIPASIRIANNYWRNTIKIRRIIILLYIYLGLSILLTFTGNENSVQESLLCAIPFGLILAHYYTVDNKLKWIRKILHIILLLAVVVFQYKFLWLRYF
ncbi:MAG: hypothetical protein KF882_05585 [Bacteroidia bacterium]|nr:hypothetical protein [Bacteroidia bacterium]MCO5254367.1 DUF6427 family protein [Bacteroidota bacterium]